MINTVSQTSEKVARYRVILTTVVSLFACVVTQSAHAYIFHYMGGHKNSIEVWRPSVNIGYLDIIYNGASDSDVFSDVVLFQPSSYFIDLTVPNQTTLQIDFMPSLNYDPLIPELDISTFTTIVNWGVLGGSSPFTFIEYNSTGQIVDQGSIINIPEPTTICLLGLGGLALRRKRRAS